MSLIKDFSKKISTLRLVYTPEWVKNKYLEFSSQADFDEKKLKIIRTEEKSYDLRNNPKDFNEIIPTIINTKCNISFSEYCWGECNNFKISSNYPNLSTSLEETIRIYKLFTSRFENNNAKYNFSLLAIEQLELRLELMKKSTEATDFYKKLLDKYLLRFKKKISPYLEDLEEEQSLSFTPNSKLEFNLKQEELAGLLFILNKSNFLNTIDFNDTEFLKFCQQFFYFKFKDGFKRPSTPKSFIDKYREFLRDENSGTLKQLKDKLQKTLREI